MAASTFEQWIYLLRTGLYESWVGALTGKGQGALQLQGCLSQEERGYREPLSLFLEVIMRMEAELTVK
jgi:hypothetical protein